MKKMVGGETVDEDGDDYGARSDGRRRKLWTKTESVTETETMDENGAGHGDGDCGQKRRR